MSETKLDLKDITFGELISNRGTTSQVYSVAKYKTQSNLVAKVLNKGTSLPEDGYTEVKALKKVGDFVASGQVPESAFKPGSRNGNTFHPVIIMQRKNGKHIFDTPQYEGLPAGKERKAFMKGIVEEYCRKVAKVAVEKELYQDDANSGNWLVNFVGNTNKVASIELLD
ncbi:hypothetical protein GYMLUDRAFT_242826 [Collybiopsis luxurians FD-317 M1]|uniref:Protein kinase domain-containing protein n=1 Tax=Collybiopsis luxurians FD-317 M1 TaxID=944289 RepID=A0A0D0CZT1_9AGAR|nr:hypothetical protein GYMLUDRAFT_242826 [Collybiopsis luxurians FD-317 M1]